MTLVAAAVCPHPPLLLPEATGTADHPDLARLREASREAVATLTAAGPDLTVIVGPAARTTRFPPDSPASLHDYGLQSEARVTLPLSLIIGRRLVDGTSPVILQAVAAGATPQECVTLGGELAGAAPRTAILAMGDGPGRRARNAPGAPDPQADAYDQLVTKALAAPDPAALAGLDPADDAILFSAGRPAWQVLAGALSAGSFEAEIRYSDAPFEVSYYIATFRHT
jgi:hypothetical protein